MEATAATANAQVRLPKSPADVPGPSSRTTMTPAYVQMVGRMAYVWGYPLVNAHNRRKGFAKATECGRNGGVLPIAPVGRNTMLTDYIKPQQTFVTCPNQDVVLPALLLGRAIGDRRNVEGTTGDRGELMRADAGGLSVTRRS